MIGPRADLHRTRGFWPVAAVVFVVVGAVALTIGVAWSRPVDESGPTAEFVTPADPTLLILGDSYTEGAVARPRTDGWAYLLADRLGWPHLINGVGGTGFSWGGGATGRNGDDYADRIRRRSADRGFVPNVLILQGGHNDYRGTPDAVRVGTAAAISVARAAWPGVQIVIIGPSQPQPGGKLLARVAAPIGAAADAARVPFIDPIRLGWFTVENSRAFSGDTGGTHLNNAGHDYLATMVLRELIALPGFRR